MKTKSRMALLVSAFNKWLEIPRVSQRSIALDVVEAADDIGLSSSLYREGWDFTRTDDLHNDARVNSQRLFRDLGRHDEHSARPDRLFAIEPAIVAAMPEEIRLDYLNAVFGLSGVVIRSRQVSEADIDAPRMAAMLTKEQAEAQVAVIELGLTPDYSAAQKAHREVAEAVDAGAAVLGEIERKFPRLAGWKPRSEVAQTVHRFGVAQNGGCSKEVSNG